MREPRRNAGDPRKRRTGSVRSSSAAEDVVLVVASASGEGVGDRLSL